MHAGAVRAIFHRPRPLAIGLAMAVLLTGLSACSDKTTSELVITHVNVIPMTSEDLVLQDQDVVVRDGKIAAIHASASYEGAGQSTVDGRDKWLIPGLTDAHV